MLDNHTIVLTPASFIDTDFFPMFSFRNRYALPKSTIDELVLSPYTNNLELDDWCVLTLLSFLTNQEEYLFSIIHNDFNNSNSYILGRHHNISNSFFNNYTLFLASIFLEDEFHRYSSFFKKHFHITHHTSLLTANAHLSHFLHHDFIDANKLFSDVFSIHVYILCELSNLSEEWSNQFKPFVLLEQITHLSYIILSDQTRFHKIFLLYNFCPKHKHEIYFAYIHNFFQTITTKSTYEFFISNGSVNTEFSKLLTNQEFSALAFKQNNTDLLPFCNIEEDIKTHPHLFT